MTETPGGNEVGIDGSLEKLRAESRSGRKRIWDEQEWEGLSREERCDLATWIFDLIESDVRDALQAATFGVRDDEHTSRTVSLVDELGWRELNRIQDEALWQTLAVKADSAARLAESGEEGVPVLSAMLCFEMETLRELPPAPD